MERKGRIHISPLSPVDYNATPHPAQSYSAAHFVSHFPKSPIGLPFSRVNTGSSGLFPAVHIEMIARTSCVILMTRASLFFVAPGLRSIVPRKRSTCFNAQFARRFRASPTSKCCKPPTTLASRAPLSLLPLPESHNFRSSKNPHECCLLKHRETGHTKCLWWSSLVAEVEPTTKQS